MVETNLGKNGTNEFFPKLRSSRFRLTVYHTRKLNKFCSAVVCV